MMLGSPPLVRERHLTTRYSRPAAGITPARAGKTFSVAFLSPRFRDHPRSCGKDSERSAKPWPITGSPPLVRERPVHRRDGGRCIGITPARAGKTSSSMVPPKSMQDHPRSCGKDCITSWSIILFLGSPPLVRERHVISSQRKRILGITPARAGKTGRTSSYYTGTRDHPRSCGKDIPLQAFIDTEPGSPPLVRERPEFSRIVRHTIGITPARAGKTIIALGTWGQQQDHPRSCGKDRTASTLKCSGAGSPPLVRERPVCSYPTPSCVGITPARAGKTGRMR